MGPPHIRRLLERRVTGVWMEATGQQALGRVLNQQRKRLLRSESVQQHMGHLGLRASCANVSCRRSRLRFLPRVPLNCKTQIITVSAP